MPIQAQPAVYNGIRFRSRLEARWAIFFDRLRVPYHYEPRGFQFGDVWYLPDFYLPRQCWWVEIKGQTPTEHELYKAGMLATTTKESVLLFAGKTWLNTPGHIFAANDDGNEAYRVVPGNYWCRCPQCGGLAVYLRGYGRVACQICEQLLDDMSDVLFEDAILRDAFTQAYTAELWKSWYR